MTELSKLHPEDTYHGMEIFLDDTEVREQDTIIEKGLLVIADAVCALMLVTLLGLLVFSILARDVFLFPTPWLEEIATLVTVYAVAAASIGAWMRNAHIAIDIVPLMFKGKFRKYYDVLLQLLSLVFLMLAAYGALEMMERSANNRTTSLAISFAWYYGGLVCAFSGMFLASILKTVRDFRTKEDVK